MTIRLTVTAIFAALVLAPVTPATAGPAEAYAAVERDYERWLLAGSPEAATAIGVRDFDDQVSDLSLAGADRRTAAAAALLGRLDAIAPATLPPATRINQAIMHRLLAESVAGNQFGQRMMLFTTYAGWHQNFAGLADAVPLTTLADHRSYLTRIAQYPTVNDTALAVTRQAVAAGHVLPCDVLGGGERSIAGLIAATPEQSRFYAPFARARPATIAPADWSAMQAEARTLVSTRINPALEKHRAYFVTEYLPRCARAPGIAAQPGGSAYYAHRIRVETTTDMSADAIHTLGLGEVARIRAEMDTLAAASGFASRAAMIADLRTNPRHYAASPEALMQRVARITRRIDGTMPQLFGRLPRLPYTLREIPAETAEGTTTAYYSPGSPSAGIAGTYYVNTSKLDQRPLWEIPALSMHEAVPGHHHQIALQQELDLPLWRRHFTGFTAFVEGWGLYAERLGLETGLYDTPESQMGRLSYEMWRACRLVVDTGLHARGWTKAQAIAFMTDNSALSAANIEAEVNRYISWPGQALGYKIGELRIRAARARAEAALGSRFDLRGFHDAVLAQGPVPLDILDAQIDAWIADQQRGVTSAG